MDDYKQEVRLKSLKTLQSYMRHRRLRTAYAVAKKADLRTPQGRVADGRVQHLVSGRRKTCRLDTALAVAEALDVPIDALFEVTEYRVPRYRAA